MAQLRDLTGWRFGQLTVQRRAPDRITSGGNAKVCWFCECTCGRTKSIPALSLTVGNTRACGIGRCRYPLSPGEAALHDVVNTYRNAARKRGLAWELSLEAVTELVRRDCHYCGAPPSRRRKVSGNGELVWNGIDRVDSSLGYVSGNVVPCCRVCNNAKGTLSKAEFVAWIRRVAVHLQVYELNVDGVR